MTTLLYVLIGLAAVYLVYSFGRRKGNGQATQSLQDETDASSHSDSHSDLHKEHKKRSGGCC